ncbi:MAG: hypothetical protein LBC78_04560, partial [Oscillospiraceae bacterium]|nr:hypothetical protein [Oscillospiraceae bacterium]
MSSKVLPLIVIMVVVVVFFQLMNPGYLGQRNILIMFKSMSLVGILGVGISMLLLSGEIDLATSAEATLSGVLVGILLSRGVPWLLAVLITLAGGAIMGAVNALLVNGLNMMSFIATIGISSVWSGVSMLITRGSPVKFSSNSGFVKMGSISVLGIFPVAFIVMIALLLVYGLILSQTKFGRSI